MDIDGIKEWRKGVDPSCPILLTDAHIEPIDWLIAEVERLQIQLRAADKYNTVIEKCIARRCAEIADNNMGDSHYPQVEIAMNIRREFNLPKAG